MGKKRTAIVGDLLSEEEQLKQERLKRQKEAAKQTKTAHVSGQKGGERVKDLSAEMLAEAETVEKKLKETQEAAGAVLEKKKARPVRVRGKIYLAAKSKVESRNYPLPQALKLLRDISFAKMDSTVELHLNLNDKNQSATVELPFSTGKAKKVAVADEATLAKIEKGQIDFDVLVASSAAMPKLVRFAKVLGPKGLMPNPKNGTIVDDPAETAEKMAKSASITLKTDKDSTTVHTVVGKLSQKDEDLTANINTILTTFTGKLSRATIKSTMSPGIHLEI